MRAAPSGSRGGDDLPPKMDLPAALLRSCNGYFLDWAARAPGISSYGAWGPALVALGLSRLPSDITEAIGLRPNLAISPLAMARAYRLLAESRPDLMKILRGNVHEGTLAGLAASSELDGLATKTGTVRGADLRPDVGWIVAVGEDVVAVIARHATIPRTLAPDLARAIAPFRNARALSAARVQTFGLLPPGEVQARCADGTSGAEGVGFVAGASGPVPVPAGFSPLAELARQGPALCLTGPWRVRFPGLAVAHREYAGVFTASVPPPYVPPPGPPPTAREMKARRGSELVLRTQLGLYAAGVLAAEDSEIAGEARAALLALVAHNAGASRHPGRPILRHHPLPGVPGNQAAAGRGSGGALGSRPAAPAVDDLLAGRRRAVAGGAIAARGGGGARRRAVVLELLRRPGPVRGVGPRGRGGVRRRPGGAVREAPRTAEAPLLPRLGAD